MISWTRTITCHLVEKILAPSLRSVVVRSLLALAVLAVALPAQAPEPRAEADPAAIAGIVKAVAGKLKKPALIDLVQQLQDELRRQVPMFADAGGWIASTRGMAARLATATEPVPNEFGPIRTVSSKTGRPPPKVRPEVFQPRTFWYRFGNRDLVGATEERPKPGPVGLSEVDPADQLFWLLSGHVPEVELAALAIQRELDVHRTRDRLSRFLEYWRNGRESFYQALDRTSGTKEAIFFYDAMIGEFAARVAPELAKVRSLGEKHDRLRDAFLSLREYRSFIESLAYALVSTQPLPERLKRFDYATASGLAQVRDAAELLLASNRWDVAKAVEELKALLVAHPMPERLWDSYDPSTAFIDWCRKNAYPMRARIKELDPECPTLPDYELSVRCRKNRQAVELRIRSLARAFLQDRGFGTGN